MQVILPISINKRKDRKKVPKSISNSHIGTSSFVVTSGQFNYSISPSKSGYLVDGKSINTFKGKNQNLNNGVPAFNGVNMNLMQSHQNTQQQQNMINSQVSMSQSQTQNNHVQNNHLAQSLSYQHHINQQPQLQQSQYLYIQQQQQSQQQLQNQSTNQQLSNSGGLASNPLIGGNYSVSAHQSSEKKQQNMQQQLQSQLQMQKSSTTFAKFKDLFGSKRLSEANAKQFLENSNYNNIANSSANFNKSSRIIAQLQVNKMTFAAQNQNQNNSNNSNNQKSLISPKRAQIMNHGYIIEDKKKKVKQQFTEIANQMPQNITNLQQQQNNTQQVFNIQQQALLSVSKPYLKLNKDSNMKSKTGSEGSFSIPMKSLLGCNNTTDQQNNIQNSQNNNMFIIMNQAGDVNSNKDNNSIKFNSNTNSKLVDLNQNKNIDMKKLSEYKKQLESQLENINNYIQNIKQIPQGQQSAKLQQNLTINIDNPLIYDDEKIMISAPQSVRNTKDSNHNSNSTTLGSSQYNQNSNNNSVQFFNFNSKHGIQGVGNSKDEQQTELNGNNIKTIYSNQAMLQENKATPSLKLFPKTATSRDCNSNQVNNNQQFFLSTKAQNKTQHIKRLTLDSTFSQTLQSQRVPTSNNQLSSILSQSIQHFNQNNQNGQGGTVQLAQQLIPNNINLQIINKQDINNNLAMQLNKLKDRLFKILNNYKTNKESSDKFNSQLISKLNTLSNKHSNTATQQNIQTKQNQIQGQFQQTNSIYHSKSNSFQQVQQIPQQALPLHSYNNGQKSLSQSQQFFLQKSSENQQMGGSGNNHSNNQMNQLMNSVQNLNSNQNQNNEILKKEYYSNPQQLISQSYILQQNNGILQQQAIIDHSVGQSMNNNNFNNMQNSKNTSQSPPFTTTSKLKNNQNFIQSPQASKQIQFFTNK